MFWTYISVISQLSLELTEQIFFPIFSMILENHNCNISQNSMFGKKDPKWFQNVVFNGFWTVLLIFA